MKRIKTYLSYPSNALYTDFLLIPISLDIAVAPIPSSFNLRT